MGRDLFAEPCLRKNGVTMIDVFAKGPADHADARFKSTD